MTARTPTLNPSVSPLVDSQFPLVHREGSPLFVAFVRAYHEWMESPSGVGSSTLYSRAFPDLRDVDSSVEPFLVHVKQKYLDGIQLTTESDTRQLIKHAKDLYRAKGTPRALDLFFRLLYDEVVSLYYPKDDVFTLSSGTWTKPTYLELSLSDANAGLDGKRLVGLTSGALGFVDGVVRRTVNGRLLDVAYVSAVTGQFQTGEVVTPSDGSVHAGDSPTVIGSMNRVAIDPSGSGSGYEVGDVLPVNSPFGVLGLARVTGTVDRTGIISLSLDDPGYGYRANSVLTVSERVLTVSDVAYTNNQVRNPVTTFDRISQPYASYPFLNATGAIAAGAGVTAWYANGSVSGTGTVLSSVYSNSSAGTLVVGVNSGNLNANAIGTAANAALANLNLLVGFTDLTFSGTVIGYGTANVNLTLASQSGDFQQGELVVQSNPLFPTDGSALGTGVVVKAPTGFLTLSNVVGIFQNGTVTGKSSGTRANASSVSLSVGVSGVTGTPTNVAGNRVSTPSFTGTVSFASGQISSTFAIANSFQYAETVSLNADLLGPIANVMIVGPYGLAGNAAADSSTNTGTYLSWSNSLIGSLSSLLAVNPGTQLDSPPIVLVEEPATRVMQRFDQTLTYTGVTSSFSPGELVVQAATGARGLLRSIGPTQMSVTQLRLNGNNSFVPTTGYSTVLVGSLSGAQANVALVAPDRDRPPVGIDARVTAGASTSNGAVTSVQVLDSGFGYVQGETVWLGEGTFGLTDASGSVELLTSGTGRGFYSQKGGFLSDQKKLFDGDYYQNFSYEVSSSQTLDRYAEALKRVVHVAGMKVFGRFRHPTNVASARVRTGPAALAVRVGEAIGTGSSSGSASALGVKFPSGTVAGHATVAATGSSRANSVGSSVGSASAHG